MEIKLEEVEIFQKYFGSKLKEKIYVNGGKENDKGFITVGYCHRAYCVFVGKTPKGSEGIVKWGRSLKEMTIIFSTPNQQGIGFEECCSQIKHFIDSQIDTLRDIVDR